MASNTRVTKTYVEVPAREGTSKTRATKTYSEAVGRGAASKTRATKTYIEVVVQLPVAYWGIRAGGAL